MSIIPSAAPNNTNPSTLSPEREATIRRLPGDTLRSVIDLDDALEDVLAELDRLRAELAVKPAEVVEYGVAFKATDQDDVEVHTPTDSREEAEARVSRYLDMYPTAHLVQRAVRHGEWIEAVS